MMLLYSNIQEPKNVKLLYDVLHFSPKDIDRAVLFATNNALVCETPEDANKVAYEMDKKARYDVSLNIIINSTTWHLYKEYHNNTNFYSASH